MSEPIVITRDKVKRGWSDLEPKIAIAGVVGFLAIVALIIAKQFNVVLPSEVASAATICFALLAGYLTPSAGTVVTRRTEGATTTESHSAPTVTTVSTPIQLPRQQSTEPVQSSGATFNAQVADAIRESDGTYRTTDQPGFTAILTPPDEQPTEVAPQYSRGASFFEARSNLDN